MRIEKLNKDKIKVTLTTAELINLDIDVKRLSPDSKELHTFLFHIMETIREETGFNPYNGQVVVEATPSQDGILSKASLFKLNKTYCILIRNDNENMRGINVIREFTERMSIYPLQNEYIKEHALLVAKGQKLVEMAENVKRLM